MTGKKKKHNTNEEKNCPATINDLINSDLYPHKKSSKNKNKSQSDSDNVDNNNSSNSSNNNDNDEDDGSYPQNTIFYLQMMYIIAIILWIIIVIWLKLYNTNFFGFLILAAPIVFFIIAFASLTGINREVENYMLQTDFLQFGYIVVVIVLIWDKTIDDEKIYSLVGIGMVLLVLSMLDIWITKEKLVYMKHFQSIVQTIAAVILIFTLFYYYSLYVCKQEHERGDLPGKPSTEPNKVKN